jgi:signal transduction histidine kinase
MIDTSLLVHLYLVVAGGAAGASLTALAAWVVHRENRSHAPFAIGAGAAAVVFVALARYLGARTPEAAASALRLQVFGVLVALPASAWFFARLGGRRPSPLALAVLIGNSASFAIANAMAPWSLHYNSIVAPQGATGPLEYVTTVGAGSALYHAGGLVPLAFCIRYGLVLHREHHRALAVTAFAVSLFLALGVVAGAAMDFGNVPRTYLGTVPVLIAFLVLMGIATGIDQREQRVERAAAAAGLAEANVQLRAEIGNRERLERRLVQTQKMEALGRMAAGVAHDFNNVLLVLRGQAQLALGRGHAAPDDREAFLAIEAAADRGAALTRQLLAFTRHEVLTPVSLSPGRAIAGMLPLLTRMAGHGVEMALHEEPARPAILADPTRFEQVVMNLVVNARDAMPDGGRITIVEQLVRDAAAAGCPCEGAVPGPHVRLTFADTGAGMDAETLSRVFEPFFTTKDSGCGTGLGLATVYGVVNQAGGQITAASRPGEGAVFSICWPCASAQESVEAARGSVRDSALA